MSREHDLASLAEREEGIRLALEYPSGAERPGGYVAHYSRAGCLAALGEIAAERARLQSRQSRRAPAIPREGCASRPGRPAVPVQNRRKTLIKSLIGAAVIGADILFGMALPEVIRNLHHETRSHLYSAIGVYAVLVLLTLWVILSVVRTVSGSAGPKPAAPAPRPGYQSWGPR